MTNTKMKFEVGKRYRFLYPRHNFRGIKSPAELRRVLVKAVRDMRAQPIEPEWDGVNPTLNRGRWLVICDDLDKGKERQFYLESMENVSEMTTDECKTLPNSEYCVVEFSRVAFSSASFSESIAYQMGSKRGIICAVMARELEVI